jgi:hypothetical protein
MNKQLKIAVKLSVCGNQLKASARVIGGVGHADRIKEENKRREQTEPASFTHSSEK